MNDNLDDRISALEDAHAIETTMNLHVRNFDSVVNGRASGLDVSIYDERLQWQCETFRACDGVQDFARFVSEYADRVSFSLQLLTPLGLDIQTDRSGGTGTWGVWQPFTLDGEPWVLAGRYENRVVRKHSWVLTTIELKVDILASWSDGWGEEKISPKWNW
jgi:hypothetical protein